MQKESGKAGGLSLTVLHGNLYKIEKKKISLMQGGSSSGQLKNRVSI